MNTSPDGTPIVDGVIRRPPRHIPIDWSKVKTVEDIGLILSELNLCVNKDGSGYEKLKGFLKDE